MQVPHPPQAPFAKCTQGKRVRDDNLDRQRWRLIDAVDENYAFFFVYFD